MAKAKLYQHNGKQYTIKQLCQMKDPPANPNTARGIINRVGVAGFLDYDIIAGEIKARNSGRVNVLK